MYTPDPHTVYAQEWGFPNNPGAWQATGYLSMVSTNDDVKYLQFYGTASGLNDKGVILVNEWDTPGPTLQKVWTPNVQGLSVTGTTQATLPLGSLGGTYGFASALNNDNQIVGWSQIASGAPHAFLWMNGKMQDLNLLIPPTSGITLIDAVGIDASGRIVAYGTDTSGEMEEFLLTPHQVTPTPEPNTLLVFIGLGIAASIKLKKGRGRRSDGLG
jgi:probable HAF family extracellular repeat protein